MKRILICLGLLIGMLHGMSENGVSGWMKESRAEFDF